MSELNYQPIKHQDHSRHHQHNNLHHNHNHHHHHHQHQHQHVTITHNTSIQGLLTVLALSFHAIFEGLAVGLEPSISSVVYLAAAIATHKLVISFCVGMELYVAGASTRATLGYLSIFSMVTPIGIGIGLALGHLKNDSENLGTTPTILQGMAAGTLLYVVFFEVLARERANEKSGLLQLLAIIVGFTLMLGLQIASEFVSRKKSAPERDVTGRIDSYYRHHARFRFSSSASRVIARISACLPERGIA